MSEWYYAQDNQQRQGPLSDEALVGLFRDGRIALATLVWREGQAQWQPLGDFADELDLVASPEAVAPGTTAPPPLAAAYANTRGGPASAVAPPPKQGLSGCAIAAIICVVGGVLLLAIVGILAAIAVPAYQDYTVRANTTQIMAQVSPLKPALAEFQATNGTCPVEGDDGFDSLEDYAYGEIGSVQVGPFSESGHCGIEATIEASDTAMSKFDGQHLWLEYDAEAGTWLCSSDIDDKYLPVQCRTGALGNTAH